MSVFKLEVVKALVPYQQEPYSMAVDAFKDDKVQLRYPEHVLTAFRTRLKGSKILGKKYTNPYTKKEETFPQDTSKLTALHLQIMARNESANVTGKIKKSLYGGLLSVEDIRFIRALVKMTTVSGVTTAHAYGGYPRNTIKKTLNPAVNTIIIDQSGYQWQSDVGNTGWLFFYLTNEQHLQWKKDTYKAMFNENRPDAPSPNVMELDGGILDLDLVAKGIKIEFLQAIDAAIAQSENLGVDEKICFRYLQAGMGFFAEGLKQKGVENDILQKARLTGILAALDELKSRNIDLKKVKKLQLPFTLLLRTTESDEISEYDSFVVKCRDLGLEIDKEYNSNDALMPEPGYTVATTNCGDPHAMPGNEGGYSSVDAAIASNANVHILNAALNSNMTPVSSTPWNVPLAEVPVDEPVAPEKVRDIDSPVSSVGCSYALYFKLISSIAVSLAGALLMAVGLVLAQPIVAAAGLGVTLVGAGAFSIFAIKEIADTATIVPLPERHGF